MLALMPPPDKSSAIHQVRQHFSERFQFKKALKPPVHITLLKPFLIPGKWALSFEKYISQIQNWAKEQCAFTIGLHNYNFFENPYHPVVYIDVAKSESLISFHANLMIELAKYHLTNGKPGNFKPHITIGYKAVTPDAFPAIKDYYSKQTFSDSFTCEAFYLWKHNGKNWEVLNTYFLNNKD
jgi:2'-5' RNA ligase